MPDQLNGVIKSIIDYPFFVVSLDATNKVVQFFGDTFKA